MQPYTHGETIDNFQVAVTNAGLPEIAPKMETAGYAAGVS